MLIQGGLVAFPTDTVYGLGCLISNPEAIERIYEVKERSHLKSIAVLIGSPDQFSLVSENIPPAALRLAQKFFPGALTLVVPRHPHLPTNLSIHPTVGVRMPNHPFAIALLNQTGPLAVTSANLSGKANPLTAQDVLEQLDGRIDLLVDGGACSGGIPSTVLDCTSSKFTVLRSGAISAEEIQSFLDDVAFS